MVLMMSRTQTSTRRGAAEDAVRSSGVAARATTTPSEAGAGQPHRLQAVPVSHEPVLQAFGWESLGRANPRRYLPTWLGGYTQPQMAENGLAPDASARIARWGARGRARKERNAVPTGEYDTPSGPISISGGPGGRQRMIQGNRQNYDGETFGSLPAYADVHASLPDEALPDLLEASPHPRGNARQRLATSIATGLTHVAEEHRSPGSGKLMRALTRRRVQDPTAPHPFDIAVNPGVGPGGPQALRDLVSGATPLSPEQRMGIDGYASASSDEEDDNYGVRKGLLRRRQSE
jgi:hypothetical protein